MAAAYTDLFCDPVNGSNLNGGGLATGAEPTAAAAYTGTGDWDGTSVFTPNDGSTPANSVNVGDWASIYVTAGATVTTWIARVTVVAAGVNGAITLSTTARAGTAVASSGAAHTITCKVGGRWQGPNAAVIFPLNLANLPSLTDSSADPPRINFKNNGTYSTTVAVTSGSTGPITLQGYTTTAGDGGRATIDAGGTATIDVMQINNALWTVRDFILQNPGVASNNHNGLTVAGGRAIIERVTVNNVRGFGFSNSTAGLFLECEAYACNLSNTASQGGFSVGAAGIELIRCTAHDNTGTNSSGFVATAGGTYDECIAAKNGLHGFNLGASSIAQFLTKCLGYDNGKSATGHGVLCNGASSSTTLDNCHWIKNAGAGVFNANSSNQIRMLNNGDYSNTSGRLSSSGGGTTTVILDTGAVTYASDPTVDGANGDFSLILAAAKNAGRGTFFLDVAKYSKSTTSYPDIGPAQTKDTAFMITRLRSYPVRVFGRRLPPPVVISGGAGSTVYVPLPALVRRYRQNVPQRRGPQLLPLPVAPGIPVPVAARNRLIVRTVQTRRMPQLLPLPVAPGVPIPMLARRIAYRQTMTRRVPQLLPLPVAPGVLVPAMGRLRLGRVQYPGRRINVIPPGLFQTQTILVKNVRTVR